MKELARLRARLEAHRDGMALPDVSRETTPEPETPALAILCRTFRLSSFERDLLLLCAAVELDAAFAPLCAAAQGDPNRPYPTFGLALAALESPHWSALLPAAPLRRWMLIRSSFERGLTSSPLRIDERILHFILGLQYLDEELTETVKPLIPAEELPVFRMNVVDRLAQLLDGRQPIVLCGRDPMELRTIAALACAKAGCPPFHLSTANVYAVASEPAHFLRRWEREAVLSNAALAVEITERSSNLDAFLPSLWATCETCGCPLIVTARDRADVQLPPAAYLDVDPPSPVENRLLWEAAAARVELPLNGQLRPVLAQFSLSDAQIQLAMREAAGLLSQADHSGDPTASVEDYLWDFCRNQTRPRLEGLAQRIPSTASWEDLVLPELQTDALKMICAQVRQRYAVYHEWGFARRHRRGLGISVLFTGPSGTGKTLAAEILAQQLRLDLYRIDLSAVVSKYIGETEKNLRLLFDAAEGCGGVLLFDESEALFGKRSEVHHSHDRFANIEIAYLLQRMEAFGGLAILTTNMKSALDNAFLRRIRMIVQFPFPETKQREQIWQKVFPPEAPTHELDFALLARLSVTGGSIRNIALNAAAIAADIGRPIGMNHVLRAAKIEYAKLERQLTEIEWTTA